MSIKIEDFISKEELDKMSEKEREIEDKMYNKSKIIESLIKDWVNKNKQ